MFVFSNSTPEELFDSASEVLCLVHVGGRANLCLALRRLIDLRIIEEYSLLRMQEFYYKGLHTECLEDVLALADPMELLSGQWMLLDALTASWDAVLAELLTEYPGAGGEAKMHLAAAYPALQRCSLLAA